MITLLPSWAQDTWRREPGRGLGEASLAAAEAQSRDGGGGTWTGTPGTAPPRAAGEGGTVAPQGGGGASRRATPRSAGPLSWRTLELLHHASSRRLTTESTAGQPLQRPFRSSSATAALDVARLRRCFSARRGSACSASRRAPAGDERRPLRRRRAGGAFSFAKDVSL